MKKLWMALFALVATPTWAQNFEGTIKCSMKMEITDPKLKAEMAQAQQKMNDPKAQAEMKKLQEQMKDPQVKAMMENNPQMKAMMEKMTQGNVGDMMSNMMPKGMTIKMKDGNTLTHMDGGMMAGDFLYLKDKSVHLDRENKSYWVLPSGNGQGAMADAAKPTVTKTSETMKILGYNCIKYVAVMNEHGHTITTNMWTTTEIKDIDPKAFSKQRMDKGQSMLYEGMDGIPLRIESMTQQGNFVMEVTEIKKESLSAADFVIPSDYKETQGMYGR